MEIKHCLIIITTIIVIHQCFARFHSRKHVNATPYIVGGYNAFLDEFPFIVAIITKTKVLESYASTFRGAANIVSKHWAISAAHLTKPIHDLISNRLLYLRGNTQFWWGGESYVDHEIVEVYEHEDYSKRAKFDCDIVLLKVKKSFGYGVERPVAVAGKNYKYSTNIYGDIAGWGRFRLNYFQFADHLQQTSVRITPDFICKKAYKKKITENMFCGGWPSGERDSCSGDSGGPVLQMGVLVGLVSWGKKCGKGRFPGVYTKLSKFQDWIEDMQSRLNIRFNIHFVNEIVRVENEKKRDRSKTGKSQHLKIFC